MNLVSNYNEQLR